MKNIIKLSALVTLALMATTSQAVELVKAQPVNTLELTEVAKINLAQSFKLNMVTINPIQENAQAQIAMNTLSKTKRTENDVKVASIAE
jgi:hypothetical protein